MYVLDTSASNILTFEQTTPPNFALTDTTAYTVPGGTGAPFPFISSGSHTNFNFLSTSAITSSSLPATPVVPTPFTPLNQYLAFGHFLIL